MGDRPAARFAADLRAFDAGRRRARQELPVDQVGVERAYRREFPSDGGRGVPGAAVRGRSPVGADQLGQPVAVAVDVWPGRAERMKAASGAPAQEDRQIAGVRFPGPRSKLGLQEMVDKVGNLLIRGDGDRIGGHTIQIRRTGAASYLCTESAFWPVGEAPQVDRSGGLWCRDREVRRGA